MRRHPDDGPSLRGPILCCMLAVVALSLGPTGEAAVRSAIRDVARPGFLLAREITSCRSTLDLRRWPWSGGTPLPPAVRQDNQPGKAASEVELRRLRAELAAARHDLGAFDASLGPVGRVQPSAGGRPAVERIEAQVLDASDAAVGPGGLIVGAGRMNGVEAGRPAIAVSLDAGERAGVTADAAVLAGAAVLGRTDEVGTWTSTVVPVTAPEFRAHVRIVRETADGPVLGDEGVLEGDGRGGCVVKYIASTTAVSVGDHVYSHDPSGQIPQPLYFGRIETASLGDGAPHWEIRVRPAADFRTTAVVYVLCPKPREAVRTAAN